MRSTAHGIKRGDRVAILLPQAPEVAAIHIAIYKLGAIALPLAMLFGPDALRLPAAERRRQGAVITNAQGLAKIAEIRRAQATRWPASHWSSRSMGRATARSALPRRSRAPRPISRRSPTAADDPAMMIYTSGTTGQPKGALHAHRVLLGHMPGIETAARVLPAARRPLLDAGRLGLGRRPARLPAAEPHSACRWWRAGSRSSIPRRPSR